MYYGNNDFRDYIAHAKDHRYIYKEWKNGKWKYYYPEDEYRLKDNKGYALVKGVRTAKSSLRKAKKDFVKKYDHDGDGKFTKKGLIDRFDYNNNGKIGKSDLKEELGTQKMLMEREARKVKHTVKSKVKKFKYNVDDNKNGKIELDEAKTAVSRNAKYAKNKIRDARHDTNRDGTVDKKERVVGTTKDVAKKAERTAKKTARSIGRSIDNLRYDTNRDGKTSAYEHVKGRVGDAANKVSDAAEKANKSIKKATKRNNTKRAVSNSIDRLRYDSNRDGKTSQFEWAKGSAQDTIKKQKRKYKVKKAKKKAKKFIYDITDKAW